METNNQIQFCILIFYISTHNLDLFELRVINSKIVVYSQVIVYFSVLSFFQVLIKTVYIMCTLFNCCEGVASILRFTAMLKHKSF